MLPGAEVASSPSPVGAVRDGVTACAPTTAEFRPSPSSPRCVRDGRRRGSARAAPVGRPGSNSSRWTTSPARPAELSGVRADVLAGGAACTPRPARRRRGRPRALDAHRLLCAHRLGPRGVAALESARRRLDGRAASRTCREPTATTSAQPLLVTTNDYEAGLYNGDTGVVVATGRGGLVAVFGRGGEPSPCPLGRLGASAPLHAMTVHRSQGSQFDRVTVVLPPADSPLGTRETLYTAVSRATHHVRLIGQPRCARRRRLSAGGQGDRLRQRLA